PLIALTDQKFHEMQAAAVRWGFKAEDVGLVTGNRRVNPDARVLVVVAEILLNRLLHQGSGVRSQGAGDRDQGAGGRGQEAGGLLTPDPCLLTPGDGFDFSNVSAVVMDEFHNFAEPQRGIVWELSLALLPQHARLLLLSATVGNAAEFIGWLDR